MNIHSLVGNSPTFYKYSTLTVARLRGKNKNKNKNETATAPSQFSLKRRRKTERLAGACIEWKPPLYKWMPFLGNRQDALVFFLFYLLGKALQRLKRSLLSMPKYYTIFVEIARCGFIQPAINVTLHFVKIAQLPTQKPYKKPRCVQNAPGQKTCGL